MTPDVAITLLAGGAGTRFWPVSTRLKPKQFLALLGSRSLLQETYRRALLLTTPERILVLTNEDFVPLVREQLPGLPPANVVGEPLRRDTAAAVCLSSLLQQGNWGDLVNVVLASDHRIAPDEEFVRVMLSAVRAAAGSSSLYTIGISPSHPATGYGYLHRGDLLLEDGGVRHYRVDAFREKPAAELAEQYIQDGEHYWNSGMFVWRNQAVLTEFERRLPSHLSILRDACDQAGGSPPPEALRRAFEQLPTLSVDYGVMETAPDVRMVEATFQWSDVGGWQALAEFLERDEAGNSRRGRLVALDSGGNIVFCEDADELVALLGVSDLIVVRSGGKTLILPRSRAEELKDLVGTLSERGQGRDL